MQEFAQGALVAVLTAEPLNRFLDYKAPEGGLTTGAFVVVPLGPRRVLGVVWGPGEGSFDPAKIRTVVSVLDVPPMRAEMQEFLQRAADYTLTPMSMMLRLATRAPGLITPPGKRFVLRLGEATPDRLTPARTRVLETLAAHGGAGFAPGELASVAGVSSSVLKGLEVQGVLLRMEAPRDGPYPLLDAARAGHPLTEDQTGGGGPDQGPPSPGAAAGDRAYGRVSGPG